SAVGTKIETSMLYGSFEARIRFTNVSGTVGALYFISPIQGEIDIETVSAVKPPQTYFALHPAAPTVNGRANNLTHENHVLGFDPSKEFHTYRFDWFPGYVNFYVDNQWSRYMNYNVPRDPGRLMMSHWSDNNPNFSQGPPATNAYMYVESLDVFYNTS
ncbi:concanavalin A-like lectin/glucanase, partial [Hesseltinella vesiculosa]